MGDTVGWSDDPAIHSNYQLSAINSTKEIFTNWRITHQLAHIPTLTAHAVPAIPVPPTPIPRVPLPPAPTPSPREPATTSTNPSPRVTPTQAPTASHRAPPLPNAAPQRSPRVQTSAKTTPATPIPIAHSTRYRTKKQDSCVSPLAASACRFSPTFIQEWTIPVLDIDSGK